MDQTHIGYTNWQQPDKNSMPEVKNIDLPIAAEMGVAIEGSAKWWPLEKSEAVLPEFDPYNRQSYYIEIFNRGKTPFDYSIKASEPWISINEPSGKIETEKRLMVSVDWKKTPNGKQRIPITILGPNGNTVVVYAVVNNPESPKLNKENCFIESNGYVSIEAENYTNVVNTNSVTWLKIPNLGRTSSAMTIIPVTVESQTSVSNGPRLEYKMHLFKEGDVKVKIYLSPTLNFGYTKGLSYAISFDDEEPQIINVNENDIVPDWKYPNYWNQEVSDNIRISTSNHSVKKSVEHVLKFWAVNPGLVLQKIVVETGEIKPSYLGPPQSYNGALEVKK